MCLRHRELWALRSFPTKASEGHSPSSKAPRQVENGASRSNKSTMRLAFLVNECKRMYRGGFLSYSNTLARA